MNELDLFGGLLAVTLVWFLGWCVVEALARRHEAEPRTKGASNMDGDSQSLADRIVAYVDTHGMSLDMGLAEDLDRDSIDIRRAVRRDPRLAMVHGNRVALASELARVRRELAAKRGETKAGDGETNLPEGETPDE